MSSLFSKFHDPIKTKAKSGAMDHWQVTAWLWEPWKHAGNLFCSVLGRRWGWLCHSKSSSLGEEESWILTWWKELCFEYRQCPELAGQCPLIPVKMVAHHALFWKAEKHDFHSLGLFLFSPELSDIWQPKICILNLKSGQTKDFRQNFALGLLNHGRVQFRFFFFF